MSRARVNEGSCKRIVAMRAKMKMLRVTRRVLAKKGMSDLREVSPALDWIWCARRCFGNLALMVRGWVDQNRCCAAQVMMSGKFVHVICNGRVKHVQRLAAPGSFLFGQVPDRRRL
jgi:hypothetical protein